MSAEWLAGSWVFALGTPFQMIIRAFTHPSRHPLIPQALTASPPHTKQNPGELPSGTHITSQWVQSELGPDAPSFPAQGLYRERKCIL